MRTLAGAARVLGAATALVLSACSAPAARPSQPAGPATAVAADRSGPRPVSAWPAALHDARHGSEVDATVVGPQVGQPRWQRRLEGPVTPGPAVATDGTVYSASNGGVLHALDPATGADRWVFDGGSRYGSDLSTTSAVLADGTILWPGPADTLFALDGGGHLLWQERFAGFVLSPADGGGGRVFVMDMSGVLTAIDVGAAEHRVAWHLSLGSTSYGAPAIAPDGRVVTSVDDEVVSVLDQGEAGAVSWRWRAPAIIEVSPAVAPDGTVVVGPNDEWAYGIADDGTLRWRWNKGDWSYSSAVVTPDGRAWFGDHLGFLDVVDSATGAVVRRLPTIPKSEPHPGGVGVWTSPAVDGMGDVYFGTVVGHIYGFGPDGHRLFDFDTGATVDSYPALGADGTLYIGSTNGILYAF